MNHQFFIAPWFFALGCLAGIGHFLLMALQVRALVRRDSGALTGSLRFAMTPLIFLAAAMTGALALAAALAGFVATRALALHFAGKVLR